jgi:hypothetical protein
MRYVTFNPQHNTLGFTKEFSDPNELSIEEHKDEYFLDESDVRRFLNEVKEHPEENAKFVYDHINHMLVYEGTFDTEEAFNAAMVKRYGQGTPLVLNVDTVRGWML